VPSEAAILNFFAAGREKHTSAANYCFVTMAMVLVMNTVIFVAKHINIFLLSLSIIQLKISYGLLKKLLRVLHSH